MNSDFFEVEALVEALVTKFADCSEYFTSTNICSVLFGMQSMSSNSQAARALLQQLEPKLRTCTDDFSAKLLSDAVFGKITGPCEKYTLLP